MEKSTESEILIKCRCLPKSMGKTIEEHLTDLKKSLETLSSLTAWRSLKFEERRAGEPPAFQMYDPTETEIKRQFTFFLMTLLESRAALMKLPSSKRQGAKSELSDLETEFNRLAWTERLKSD